MPDLHSKKIHNNKKDSAISKNKRLIYKFPKKKTKKKEKSECEKCFKVQGTLECAINFP